MKTKTNYCTFTRLTSGVRQRASIFIAALFCSTMMLSSVAMAQLSGNKFIPGDYATITTAVADLNSQGVGAGGVTFNVAAGYTETISGTIALTATGTAANPIVFQKDLNTSGANPLITAYIGGTGTPGSALQDGIWRLAGSDYVTIDSIDLTDNPANTTNPSTMEYGYALYKASATDGAQNNTIKNCTITLNRINNATGSGPAVDGSRGIDVVNAAPGAATTALIVTSASGANSNNKFYGNTIQNCNIGIALIGFADVSPFTNADTGNDVGGVSAATGNQILNYGGGAATNPAAGIRTLAQYNENISFNTINSNNGAGFNHATTLRGIYNNTAVSASATISNNSVTVKGGGTNSALTAIENVAGATAAGNTISISSNTITGCTYTTATSGAFTGITTTASAANVNINSNILSNNATNATSGTTNLISNSGAATVAININSNTINGWTFNAATSGAFNGITSSAGAATAALSISANDIQGIVHSVAGSSTHTYITWTHGASGTDTVNLNTFTNLNVNTTGSINFLTRGTTSMTATGVTNITNNSIVTGFNKGGAGNTVTFLNTGAGDTSPVGAVYNETGNNFSNVTLTGATAVAGWSDVNGPSGGGVAKTITGNTFSNISTGSASVTCIAQNFGGNGTAVSSNTISNITTAPTATGTTLTGISIGSSSGGATHTVANNAISGLSSTGTGGQAIGILGGSTSITTFNINGNTISGITSTSTAGPVVAGIFNQNTGATVNIFKNKVYDVVCSPGATIGINSTAAAATNTINVYNNIVGRLYATTSTFFQAARGLLLQGTVAATFNAYYNTVYLDGTTPGQTYCIYIGSTVNNVPNVDARDNIFVNNVSSSNGAALPQSVYFRFGTTTATDLASTTNNNLLYAGTPAVDHLIYVDGSVSVLTNPQQTLASYKTFVGSRESASVTELPPFLNTVNGALANYLHIDPTIATQVESGGMAIAGITDDFDGQTRNATTPDIGADEFSGIGVDLSPPAISYTQLGNTASTANRTLTATISDATGVASGANLPRIYFKKSTEGSYVSTQCTMTGGTAQNGTYDCTIDNSLVGGGSVMANDTVQYFVVAQDTVGNLGSNPAGASGADVNSITFSGAPNSYLILPTISGNKNVGAGGDYTTLTAAVAALNGAQLSGPVTLTLTDNTYPGETYPIVINANAGSSSTNTITIKPTTGVTPSFSGSSTSCIINLNGADWVIIDGSNTAGGTTRDTTVTNTNGGTSSADICITSTGVGAGATNNTVKNTNLVGSTVTATAGTLAGVFSGSSVISITSTGADNDNNTIQNNSITKTQYGIYTGGASAANKNLGTVITQNVMNAASPNNVTTGGILANFEDGIQITQNDIGNIIKHDGTTGTTGTVFGIALGVAPSNTVTSFTGNDVINATVSRNKINVLTQLNSTGYSGFGIVVNSVTSGTTLVSNNMISGIRTASTASDFSGGIIAGGGTGSTTQISFNSVSMTGTRGAASFPSYGLAINSGDPTIDVRNNIFYNTQTSTGAAKMYAIGTGGTTFANLTSDYNDFFVTGTSGFVGQTGGLGTAGADRASLANWQSATGKDASSKNVDPLFVSTGDLHLQLSSTLLGMGVTVGGITTDFDGDLRQSPPDIGADEIVTYTLTYTAGPNGSILGTTPQTVLQGGDGTPVTAVPDTGYHFVNWSDSSTDNPRTDTNVQMDITVTANFAINTYTLDYASGGNGSITGDVSQVVNYGANGTPVTAVPNTGYHFVNWSDSSTDNPRTDMNVMANVSVTANFAINTYTLTYTAGSNGSISGTSPQIVNYGDNGTTVTAVPDTGYHFVNWSDASTDNPRTDMNVMANVNVTATFAINTYTLTYTAGPNGSITGTSPQTVNYGDSGTTVTAVPDTGYHFVSWSDSSTDNPRTDTNVMANVNVMATFAINTYTLDYASGGNGSVTGDLSQTVNYGGSGTPVTAVPDTGYHFVNWSDSSTDNPRTDTNVMANVNVTATFAINTYTLTYTAGSNGSISGTSPQTVNYGDNGTPVTAVADSGYHFVNWSDASIDNPRTDMNVMANVTVTANFAVDGSSNADLSDLSASAGPLSPAFDPGTTTYTVNVPFSTMSTTVTPTAADPSATITVNAVPVTSGNPSGPIALAIGHNVITIVVTAGDTTTMKTYTIDVIRGGNVSVSGSTGADGMYATLKDAFDALNLNGTQAGNVIAVSIIGDTTETATAALNQPGVSSWTSLTITPSGSRTVTGSVATALVDLAGADNVTIDGLNASGNSLTISNAGTGATASTIRFINGAMNNTVTNCSLLGSSSGAVSAASGTILIGTSTSGANSGNTISNNDIGPAGANLPTKGFTSLGSASPNNNAGNILDNNNIFDFFSPTISVSGISLQANTTTATVSNNRLYQTAPRAFTGSALSYTGITSAIGTGAGTATITGNKVGFGAANGTGTTTISGSTGTFGGLSLSSASTTTPTSVQNNTVSGISLSSAGNGVVVFSGIFVAGGRYDVGTTTGNKIGSLDGSSTITITLSSNGAVYLLRDSSSSSNTIANNQIGAVTINGSGAGTNGFRGILLSQAVTTVTATLTNNQVGGSGAGGITDSLVGGYAMYAIANSSGNLIATGNTVQNITGNSNGTNLIVISGMLLTGTGTVAPNVISQNVIHSLSNNSGAASNSIYALYCSFPAATANVVERNLVHSLSITSSNLMSQLVGILPVAGTGTYKNNMVRLGIDAAGASITPGYVMYGMFEIAGTNNLYYNSVYIGGSGVASSGNTFAFVSNVVTNARNYKDNIFWNARSNASGGGKNYAIAVGGTTPNPAGLTSDYNDLFANGTGGFVGLFNATDQLTLANWQTATGQDANSISADPQFVNPTGPAPIAPPVPNLALPPVDLHITCESPADGAGTPIAGITTDFDNETRDATNPDIGADEINLVAPAAVSAASRKVHGAAGPFDINLPFAGPAGVESRSGGVMGDYQVIFTFATNVNVSNAVISSGSGMVSGVTGNGTNTIAVDVTGVTNAQYVTVKLLCVDDGANLGSVSATMGVLVGDVTADGSVNATDVSPVKMNAGNAVDMTNFRSDVDANGSINASDVGLTKLGSGTALPQ